ncbi:MAG: alpha/beta fold hydrolase, partial [Calditrichaeota bacterium]
MTLAEWQSTGQRFAFHHHSIFYHDQGKGPALVCLHGFPTASWDWHRLWPHLVQRYRVIAPDFLGFGFSDKPRHHSYSLFEQAHLIEKLLHALDVQAVHLLAHDYGDTVAQELLARQQHSPHSALRILSVSLLNGGLFPEAIHPRAIQKWLLSPAGPWVSRLITASRFRKSFSAVFGPHTRPSSQELLEFWRLITHKNGHHIAHRIIRYMKERQAHRERWVGALQNAGVPLQFIVGDADPVSGAAMAQRFRVLVPQGRVEMLKGIGHYPQ